MGFLENSFGEPKEPEGEKKFKIPEAYMGEKDYTGEDFLYYEGDAPDLKIVLKPFFDENPEAAALFEEEFEKVKKIEVGSKSREKLFNILETWREGLKQNEGNLAEIGILALHGLERILNADEPEW